MLKYLQIISLSFVLLSWMGCSSDDEEGQTCFPQTATHSKCMALQGNVRHVEVYNEELDMTEVKADFDASGRCLFWDATGVPEEENVPSKTKSMGSGWLSTPARYHYTYNEKGQLVSVVRQQLGGETEHFTITYGWHQLWLPLPFPIASLSPYMVQGIESITSEHYHLVCDGVEAHADHQILSWMSLRETTDFVFENQKVVEQHARLYSTSADGSETQIQRTRTFFEYGTNQLQRMLEVTVDDEGYQEKTESIFSLHRPYQLLQKRFYTGMEMTPLYVTGYQYDEAGRLISVDDKSGDGFFETPYTQAYSSFDRMGNWATALKTYSEEENYHLTQHIVYW